MWRRELVGATRAIGSRRQSLQTQERRAMARVDDQLMECQGIDEDRLVEGLRSGDELAYEQMVRAFGGRMLAVARRIVRNEEDAHDAVQTAYLSAFRAIGTFEGGCRLSTWLHRIVVNAALMKLRRDRRRPEESIEALLPRFQEDGHHVERFSPTDLPADVQLERAEFRAIIRECIAELPEAYRTVLLMRDIEDLSTNEVADILRITPNAAKIRLHRARQALTTLLRRRFAETQSASGMSVAVRKAS
jgi:RNA polymerase sigma-70 factor, ECF subfamily